MMKIRFYLSPNLSKIFVLGLLSPFALVGFMAIDSSWGAEADKERWNNKYETENYLFGRDPIPFLTDHVDLLPKGAALDLAMGEGRNGVFLATKRLSGHRGRYFRGGFQKSPSPRCRERREADHSRRRPGTIHYSS